MPGMQHTFIIIVFIFQNQWLGLPQGMTSKSPEFQQRLRWSLLTTAGKLLVLLLVTGVTAYCWKVVYCDRKKIEEEGGRGGAEYHVKAEYKQEAPQASTSRRSSYRRPSGDIYSIAMGEGADGRVTRQTSLDTTYNVPSIRSEVMAQPRFDSIPEMEGEIEGRRNQGFLL